MMTFNEFVKKFILKNKTTSNLKVQRVLDSIGLYEFGTFLRDEPFSSDIGIVNIHTSKGTHWVIYIHECYFDSYGITLPRKLSKFIIKRYGDCLCSEYKIQGLTNKRDSYCSSYVSYIVYLTKMLGVDFKSAVLTLYYQMIK